MTVDYLIVADAATAQGAKHYVHGGGWDTIWGSSFPLQSHFAVAARFRVPWHDTNQKHEIELDVVDADLRSVLPVPPGPMGGVITTGRPAHLAVGDDQVVPLTFSFTGIQFDTPGTYAVTLRIDGMEVARSPFYVRAAPPGLMAGAVAAAQ